MALAPQALLRGLVAKAASLVQRNVDSYQSDVALRLHSYGEVTTQPMVRKQYNLLDEGSYFVAANAQTAVAMTTTAAFSATAPFVLIQNLDPIGGRNIYLDYVNLANTVAGTAASALTYTGASLVVDSTLRYSSGGTALTIAGPNMSINASSPAAVYAGAITATAASAAARTIVGQRVVRPAVSATVATVVGDNLTFNFGGVEGGSAGTITIANPNIIPVAMPGVEIGPQQSAMLYLYYQASGTPVAAQWIPEVGFFAR